MRAGGETNLTQHRAITARSIRAAFRKDPQEAKRLFVERMLQPLVAGLAYCIKRRDPWAMRLGFEIAGWVGQQTQVANLVLQQIGVSPEAARRSVDLVAQYEGQGEAELVQECERTLLEVYRRNPSALATGPFELKRESKAEEVGE